MKLSVNKNRLQTLWPLIYFLKPQILLKEGYFHINFCHDKSFLLSNLPKWVHIKIIKTNESFVIWNLLSFLPAQKTLGGETMRADFFLRVYKFLRSGIFATDIIWQRMKFYFTPRKVILLHFNVLKLNFLIKFLKAELLNWARPISDGP